MTMGEYIRELRCSLDLTQEELGQKLVPPVNRAAVNKWEKGLVENIKRTHIEQLAKMFGVTPSELMCFETTDDEKRISEEVKTIEAVQKLFGNDAVQLLQYFTELNDEGKEKALTDIGDLTEIPKYTKSSR